MACRRTLDLVLRVMEGVEENWGLCTPRFHGFLRNDPVASAHVTTSNYIRAKKMRERERERMESNRAYPHTGLSV